MRLIKGLFVVCAALFAMSTPPHMLWAQNASPNFKFVPYPEIKQLFDTPTYEFEFTCKDPLYRPITALYDVRPETLPGGPPGREEPGSLEVRRINVGGASYEKLFLQVHTGSFLRRTIKIDVTLVCVARANFGK